MSLVKGSLLYTKDGRKIGNGIVINVLDLPVLGKTCIVKTDFGNTVTLSEAEVERQFYVSKLAYVDPLEQVKEQIALLDENFPDFV